jgi:hypothetical protein
MKQKLFISTVVASLIMGTISLSAKEVIFTPIKENNLTQHSKNIVNIKKSINQEVKLQKEKFKEASTEIMDGLKKIFTAKNALKNNQVNQAKELLKESIKLFEIALKSEPKLGLIPIAQEININAFSGNAKELQSYIDKTINLLKKHDTQNARVMLFRLEDEMVIVTQKIPIEAYLLSTKEALKLLESDKEKEAFSTLVTGLSLMEIDTVIMPIPLMVTENLIIDASQLDKSEKEKAKNLLTMAEDELDKAVLLGYTQKYSPEYKLLSQTIIEIQKEIKGQNMVEKLYDKLKETLKGLMIKSREEIVKQKAQNHKELREEISEPSKLNSNTKLDENKTIQ